MKCVICQKAVGIRKTNPSYPFCSPRCRAVDLGKWLGEEYRVPAGVPEEQEDEVPVPKEESDSDDADA